MTRIREPAFWAIRAGRVRAPRWAPLWVRVGGHEAKRMLARMLDTFTAARRR